MDNLKIWWASMTQKTWFKPALIGTAVLGAVVGLVFAFKGRVKNGVKKIGRR